LDSYLFKSSPVIVILQEFFMSKEDIVNVSDIYMARKRIAPYIRKTPLVESPYLSETTGSKVMLKLENLQFTGSFKPRGAANKLLSLTNEQLKRGVIAVSSGNHGKAVAYMARKLGGKAIICLYEGVPLNKIEAIRSYGAEIIMCGSTYDEAMDTMLRLKNDRDLPTAGSFDDPYLLAGHATIGLELLEDFPEVDTVLVPVALGVLPMGLAILLKKANPSTKIIAVSMERGASLIPSLRAGRLVDYIEQPSVADAIVGGLGPEPEYVLETVARYIDDTILVSDEEIADAMFFALNKHHQVIEGAGAVGIAALLNNKAKVLGSNIAVIISGGNVDISLLVEIAQQRIVN
jgi:threonine dehydratase